LTSLEGADIRARKGNFTVASNCKKSETRRLRKKQQIGKKRKRAIAVKGSTKNEAQLFGNVL
jgi:hypothetical protein